MPVQLGMCWGIRSIVTAWGGCGTRLVLLWHCWLWVPRLLLTC